MGPLPAAVPAILATLAVFVVLAAFLSVDPPSGVTGSNSPFTDEAWNVLNARNLVILGRWSTDDWNRQLVSIPFMLAHVLAFQLGGVGIVQARLVSVIGTALTVLAVGWGLRRPLGSGPALLAALALGSCALVLYYGRLALLEPTVGLWLTFGCLLVLAADGPRAALAGIAAGLCFGAAIGTKPNAAFAVAGLLMAVAAADGWRSDAVRRWLAAALGTLLVLGLAWTLLVYLPNRAQVAAVVQSWPAEALPRTAGELWRRVIGYFFIYNDTTLGLAGPLLIGGTAGGLVALATWRQRTPFERRLVAAAGAWGVTSFAVLAVLPYHPNRYAVPIMPAMAILMAVGAAVLTARLRARISSSGLLLAGLAVAGALMVPGLLRYGTWVSSTSAALPQIQARLVDAVPPGAVVEGRYAPLYLMRAPVVTLFSSPAWHLNEGDLYRTQDVRWVVASDDDIPSWALDAEASAWAARQVVFCAPWGAEPTVCLYHLP